MASFAGTLFYKRVGAAIQSYLNVTGGETALLLQSQPDTSSIEAEVAAATYTLIRVCKLPDGAEVQISGQTADLGGIPAILMTGCVPCAGN